MGGRYPFPFLVRHVVVYTKLDDGWDDDESRDDKEDEDDDDDGETHSLAWVKSLAGQSLRGRREVTSVALLFSDGKFPPTQSKTNFCPSEVQQML